MKCMGICLVGTAACIGVLSLPMGCTVAADAFNPAFFSSLGLDPGVIFPSSGTVIVSFTNETGAPATFYAHEAAGALDTSPRARNFSVVVDAGRSRNEVLDCPVAVISLGALDASFASDGIGAKVTTDGGEVDVTYAGTALADGQDFSCGDVVDVTLVQQGGGEDQEYLITVRVIPGR